MTWAERFDFHLTEWAWALALSKPQWAARHRAHLEQLVRERAALTARLIRRGFE